MPKYAQINEEKIVIAVSELRDQHKSKNLIEVEPNVKSASLLGKVWNGSGFIDPPNAADQSAETER